jgi:hypothetical protein
MTPIDMISVSPTNIGGNMAQLYYNGMEKETKRGGTSSVLLKDLPVLHKTSYI